MIKKALPYSLLALVVILLIVNLLGTTSFILQFALEGLILIASILSLFLYKKEISLKFNEKSKKGFPYWIMIILILIICLFIKLPYFEDTLKEDSLNKFQEYVEPAQHMLSSGNLAAFQYHYTTNPLNPSPLTTINHLPVYEYGFLLTYKLLPFNSLEFNTHLFVFLIGCLFLVSVYLLSNLFFPKPFSVVLVAVLAISPIVNYSSFIPVGDILMFTFLFFSLFALQKFQENKSFHSFFIASILFALGILSKVSVLVVAIPILLFFFLGNQKEKSKSGSEFIIFLFLSIFNVAVLLLFLRNYLSNFILSLLGLIVGIAILFYLFSKINLQNNIIQSTITKLGKNNLIKTISWAVFAIIIASIYYYYRNYSIGEVALANSFSIFNFALYSVLIKGIINDITRPIFFLALIGIIALFVVKIDKKSKNFLLAFLVSAAFYFILLARTILIHDYYQLAVIVTLCLFFSFFAFSISKIFKSNKTRIIFLIILLLIALPASTSQLEKLVGPDTTDTKLASEYLASIMTEDQYFLTEGAGHSLSLYSNRNRVVLQVIRTPEIAQEVETLGFSETMERLGIVYLVTTNPKIFTPYVKELLDPTLSITPDRDVILQQFLNKAGQSTNDEEKIETPAKTYEHFVPINQIGRYYFFKIV